MLSKQFFGASSKKLLQTTVVQTTKRFASASASSEPNLNNVDQDLQKFRTTIPGNPFNEYIKRYGDRPLTLQKLQVKSRRGFRIGMLMFFLPIALGYLYLDYKINEIIESGHYEPLEVFEKYRKERRGKLAEQKKDEEELAKLEAEIYGTAAHEQAPSKGAQPFVMEYNGTQVLVVPPGAKVPAGNDKKVVYVASAAQAPEQSKANVSATKNEAEPRQFKYVLIGGGTSSYYAIETIRKNDPNAEILLVTEEEYAPYSRPPLSKELWKSKDPNVSENLKYTDWSGKDRRPEYKPAEAYAKLKVVLKSKSKVVKLNPADQTIVTDDGQVYKYDKCLLATGGSPIIIPGMDTIQDEVLTFRKIDDFKKLDKFSKEEGKNVVIVGGSFLGTELAYALAANRNLNVTQIYLEPEVLARNIPRYLTKEVSSLLSKTGVQLKPNRQVASVYKRNDGKVGIKLDGGEEIAADYVLSAIGIYPNTELAETAGLEIDPVKGGIMTNSELEARNNIFVAGDVLSYYDPLLGRRRLEHYEHAVSTGKTAANNMSSTKRSPYNHISMFWSDIGPISFEAVGDINSSLATYSVWDAVDVLQNGAPWYDAPAPIQNKGFNRGIVYYLKENKVVGVLLWNVKGKVEEARKVIAENKKINDVSELRDKIKIPASKQ